MQALHQCAESSWLVQMVPSLVFSKGPLKEPVQWIDALQTPGIWRRYLVSWLRRQRSVADSTATLLIHARLQRPHTFHLEAGSEEAFSVILWSGASVIHTRVHRMIEKQSRLVYTCMIIYKQQRQTRTKTKTKHKTKIL
jgi:hypothetical protein